VVIPLLDLCGAQSEYISTYCFIFSITFSTSLSLIFCMFVCFLQFVIDTSNRQQVAAAAVQLLEMLTASSLQSSPVLIVLSKRLVIIYYHTIDIYQPDTSLVDGLL